MTDAKTLVCIFLEGGNDGANTLTPYDAATHEAYRKLRPDLAHARTALAATVLRPDVPLPNGAEYALSPALAPLLSLFDAGKLAAMLNIGTLIEPTTKTQYLANSVRVPARLGSHNDQQSFWQSSATEGASSGWGGRFGDVVLSQNAVPALTCINASASAVFLAGEEATSYAIGPNGPVPLIGNRSDLFSSPAAATALRQIMTRPSTHIFENEYARINKRSLQTFDQVSAALAKAPQTTTAFSNSDLSLQLRMVARIIALQSQLGINRQIFFVRQRGHDLHSNFSRHAGVLADLAGSMRSFHDATVALGVADTVTTFTGSDFGRTLVSNGDGSDHGWGGVAFVMGGAVKGRAIYGKSPVYADNGPDDIGQGRWIPSTSVDQYAATLGQWFGIDDAGLDKALPNLRNYPVRDLGFMG